MLRNVLMLNQRFTQRLEATLFKSLATNISILNVKNNLMTASNQSNKNLTKSSDPLFQQLRFRKSFEKGKSVNI